MKINVERGALLKALNHVQSVVERRNTIPILSNVLIEAAKGELKLTATDLDIEIVEALPADFVANALYAVSVLGTRGHTYHFADPEPPSLAEVLEQAAAHFGKRLEQGFDARSLGRMLRNGPGLWLSQQSSRALSEWRAGPRLVTRGGDRLLERAGLRAPTLLGYMDAVLLETEELRRGQRLDERHVTQPFEVVA